MRERITANKAREIMNEEKARELAKCNTCSCAKLCKGIEDDCCDEFEHLLAMARWKDEQILVKALEIRPLRIL